RGSSRGGREHVPRKPEPPHPKPLPAGERRFAARAQLLSQPHFSVFRQATTVAWNEPTNQNPVRINTSNTDRMAALIAWMLVVGVGNFVRAGAKRRRLRRSTILDKIANTNRV